MRRLVAGLALVILVSVIGCDGSGGRGGGVGGAAETGGMRGADASGTCISATCGSGGGSGSGGVNGDKGETGVGSCNYPSCLAPLAASCEPAGTCVKQTDITTFTISQCYSNGVKVVAVLDRTASSATTTFKNGDTTCFSVSEGGSLPSGTSVLKDGAGEAFASATIDANGKDVITCTEGQPVTLDSSCFLAGASSTSTPCTTGICTP